MNHIKMLCASAVITMLASGIAYGHYLDDDSSPGMEAYFYRSSLMNSIRASRDVMRGMTREDRLTNEAEFIKASKALSSQLAMIPVIFQNSATVDDSMAKPEVWENWDAFVLKANELKVFVDEITRVASRDGVEAAKPLAEDIDCGGCHDEFRNDRDE